MPWGLSPLERIIASHALPRGIITPYRGLSPLVHYPGRYFTPSKGDLLSIVRVLHPLPPFPQQLYWFSFVLVSYGKSYVWFGNVN